MKTFTTECIEAISQVEFGVLGLQGPSVVTLHHNNEDVGWARTWTARRNPFDAIIQGRGVFRLGIKGSRSCPNIAIGQKDLEPGRSLHDCLLPNRPAQCEEWIEHDLVEKNVPGRGRVFQTFQVFAEPNPRP